MVDRPRAYIDSCCFIDMVKTEVGKSLETEREKDVWFLKQLFQAGRDGEVELFTSSLTIAECTHAGDGDVSEPVKSQFARLLTSGQYVRLVQPTPFVATAARDLRWVHGLAFRGADALHLASALAMGCEEFLSSNGRLNRLTSEAKITQLDIAVRQGRETNCLPDKYRQLGLEDGNNKIN